jgi:amino acid adenylation domain-containing protein
MSDLSDRIASLSPEQRKRFEELLAREAKASRPEGIPRLPRSLGVNRSPLSFAQERLWFLEKLTPGTAQYNLPAAIRLHGPLDLRALEQSLRECVARQEALRTVIDSPGGEGVQAVSPSSDWRLTTVDLTHLPEADRFAEAKRRAAEEARRPFDLATGPLFRATLHRLAEDDHVLLLNLHHIISDGWSLGVLFRELAAFYPALAAGTPPRLQPLPVQYADYASWQRGWLQGERLQGQLTYWKEGLRGAPAVLELPTDFPRPPIQTFPSALVSAVLPRSLTHALTDLSRAEGATLFMMVLAALQAVLARYTGQDDVVVGTAIAGRPRPELEGLVGFFVNTLALRTSLAGDPPFRELLRRVRETALGAYAHQDVPFEKLVEELRPERRLSHTPLFQVMLLFQSVEMGLERLGDLRVTPLEISNGTAKFDLSWAVIERPEGLRVGLTYNTDLFRADTAARMVGHLGRLLEGVAADPGRRLSALPLLTAPEEQVILRDWNATEADYPRDRCLHELFEEQARRVPDSVAVSAPGGRLTYAELNERANRLAHRLIELGAGPGQRVAICLERTPALLVGLLGILKSGAAYVPLDPAYPAGRLAAMLEDAGTDLLVTERRLLGQLPPHGARAVPLDDDAEFSGRAAADPPHRATPDDLAYVIFTSGSTGRPKGVMVPHRGVVNLMADLARRMPLTERDVFPALASFAFDMCIPELYLALTVGARVLLAPREVSADGQRLLAELTANGATVLHATPTTWDLLLQAGWRGTPPWRMFIGAEALPPELAARLVEVGGPLCNFYGPTETTVWSSSHTLGPGDSVAVGRPLANTQIYILDRRLRSVPIGVPGEVYIGGVGVTRGYLGRPDFTAERFVPDPFGGVPGARMYRTGDLGHFRPDGVLDLLGRADRQVKVRGYRIELGDIEAALTEHPGVRQAAVTVREDTPGDKRIVGYLVSAGPSAPPPAELRGFLQKRLPDYMVPSAFVDLDAFPLSPNGKVDRRNLPAPGPAPVRPESERVPPCNPVEEEVARVWSEVLRTGPVSVHDNFFEMGGHSLLVIRLVTRLRELFQVDLPLRTVFETPTVAGLAGTITEILLGDLPPEEIAAALEQPGAENGLS